jgi:hypothetical protein
MMTNVELRTADGLPVRLTDSINVQAPKVIKNEGAATNK